jgi:hypothetical protein
MNMKFARNSIELAKELSALSGVSVTRRSLHRWRRDPRYKDYCPKPRADGRHDVRAWAIMMRRFGLRRADEAVPRDEIPAERAGICEWKEVREKLLCTQLERAISRDDAKLLVCDELEIALGQFVVGCA